MKQMLGHLTEFGSAESATRTFGHDTNNSKGFSVSNLLRIGFRRGPNNHLEGGEGETGCLALSKTKF